MQLILENVVYGIDLIRQEDFNDPRSKADTWECPFQGDRCRWDHGLFTVKARTLHGDQVRSSPILVDLHWRKFVILQTGEHKTIPFDPVEYPHGNSIWRRLVTRHESTSSDTRSCCLLAASQANLISTSSKTSTRLLMENPKRLKS